MALSTPGGVDPAPYIKIVDEKPYLTTGQALVGTPTQSYQIRDLTLIVQDTDSLASLAANVITLQPGTYRMMILVPTFNTSYHRARLVDITNSLQYLGSNASCSISDMDESFITGQFTIATAANFRIETFTWVNGTGGGTVAGDAAYNERYTTAEFWQVQV